VRARLAIEASFLIVVAAGAIVARLSPSAIVPLVLAAFVVVLVVERVTRHADSTDSGGRDNEASAAEPAAEPRTSVMDSGAGVPPEPPSSEPRREWNLWDLERRSRERAGSSAQDEESTALFVYLRPFANAEGMLPKEFDELVRESFPELIEAA
jgi:hypothetical protein